jgi:uncharacterized Zn-finger protein
METMEVVVHCKNPECKALASLGVITVESTQHPGAWMERFEPKEVKCPVCGTEASYSREDLLVAPLEK